MYKSYIHSNCDKDMFGASVVNVTSEGTHLPQHRDDNGEQKYMSHSIDAVETVRSHTLPMSLTTSSTSTTHSSTDACVLANIEKTSYVT